MSEVDSTTDWATWQCYKDTIEAFLKDGWGPPHHIPGSKGSAVQAALRQLIDQGILGAHRKSALLKWVKAQENRAAQGKRHCLPDWNLHPPYQAKHGKLGYDPVLPGFEISKVSNQLDEDGNVTKSFVSQTPTRGTLFTPDRKSTL